MDSNLPDNAQSRKWQITINNPQAANMDHEKINEILGLFCPTYFCLADEIGAKGTYHTHVFMCSKSPVRFSTVKRRFPSAHIEKAGGSPAENREYIRKEGKWAETDKAETSVPGTFEEWGELPEERPDRSQLMKQLLECIHTGNSTADIVQVYPDLALKAKEVEYLRSTIANETYAAKERNITVSYIFGSNVAAITKDIYTRHGADDIYRVTHCRSKGVTFDGYVSQNVLVFSYFDGQIPLNEMLCYLDGMPIRLPARYNDHTACYTHVYIISDVALDAQYTAEQLHKPAQWQEFCDRICNVIYYFDNGSTLYIKKDGENQYACNGS